MQTTSEGAINRSIVSIDAKGIVKTLNTEKGTNSATFSTNCTYYVNNYSSSATASEYSICNARGLKLHALLDNKAYMEKFATAPKMEFLKVKNDEGEEMDAYIIKPHDFDSSKKYPLLMYQYNG